MHRRRSLLAPEASIPVWGRRAVHNLLNLAMQQSIYLIGTVQQLGVPTSDNKHSRCTHHVHSFVVYLPVSIVTVLSRHSSLLFISLCDASRRQFPTYRVSLKKKNSSGAPHPHSLLTYPVDRSRLTKKKKAPWILLPLIIYI